MAFPSFQRQLLVLTLGGTAWAAPASAVVVCVLGPDAEVAEQVDLLRIETRKRQADLSWQAGSCSGSTELRLEGDRAVLLVDDDRVEIRAATPRERAWAVHERLMESSTPSALLDKDPIRLLPLPDAVRYWSIALGARLTAQQARGFFGPALSVRRTVWKRRVDVGLEVGHSGALGGDSGAVPPDESPAAPVGSATHGVVSARVGVVGESWSVRGGLAAGWRGQTMPGFEPGVLFSESSQMVGAPEPVPFGHGTLLQLGGTVAATVELGRRTELVVDLSVERYWPVGQPLPVDPGLLNSWRPRWGASSEAAIGWRL